MIASKYFSQTTAFNDIGAKFGPDSELLVNFIKHFPSPVNLPKTSWEKYHESFKEYHKETELVDKEISVNTIKPVKPKHYVEKPPFTSRIREHSNITTVKNRSVSKSYTPYAQIETHPQVAFIKDFSTEDLNEKMAYAPTLVRSFNHTQKAFNGIFF